MAQGPGKYDNLATIVRWRADADAVVLIVVDGNRGSGFSMQAIPGTRAGRHLPELLREIADQIEEGMG